MIGRRRPGRCTWAEALDRRLMAQDPQALVTVLVDGLNQYGRHERFCPAAHRDKPGPCECGFDEIRDLPKRSGP